jgi:uncharacterized tellurite resistance protein B-like protein
MDTNSKLTIELKSHFLRLYNIALADDRFDALELQMLYRFGEDRGIRKEELDKLFLNPVNHASNLIEDLNTKIEYLFDLTSMILADGIVEVDELNALKKYCKKFDFLDENIDEIADYLIDSVQKGITKEEIIKQLNS